METISKMKHKSGAFDLLRSRRHIGDMSFPTAGDYAAMAQMLTEAGNPQNEAFESAQRNWFQRGQTGCVLPDLRQWSLLHIGHTS